MMFSGLLGNNDSHEVREEKINTINNYEFTNIEFLKKFTFLNFYNKNIIKNNLYPKGILGNANLEKYFLFFYESYANQGIKNFKDIDIEQLRIDVNNTEDALIDESIAQLILVDKTLLSKYMNTPKASYETNNYNISEFGEYNVGDRIWGKLCINDDELIQPLPDNIDSIFESCKTNNDKNIINVESLFFIKSINQNTYIQLSNASNNSNDENREYYDVNIDDTTVIKSLKQNNLNDITLNFWNNKSNSSDYITLSQVNESQVSIIQDNEEDENSSTSYEFFVILTPYVRDMNNKIVKIYENKSEIYETIVNIDNDISDHEINNPMLVIIVPNIQEEEEEEEKEEEKEKLNNTIKSFLNDNSGMYIGRGWKVYHYNDTLLYVKNEEECGLELPSELQDYQIYDNGNYYFNFEDEKITSKESNNKYKFKNDTCTNEVTIDGNNISKYIPNNIQIGDKIWWNNCDKKDSKNEGIVKNIEGNDIFVDDKTPIKKSQIHSYKSNKTLNIEKLKKMNKQLQQLSSGIEIFKNHMSNERTIPLSINSSRSKNSIIAKIISDIYDSLIYYLNSTNNNRNFLNLCIYILENRKNDEIDFFNTGKSEEKRFKEEPFLFSGEFEDFPKHIVDINDILTLQHTDEYERIKYDNTDIDNWILKLNRISTIIQTNSQYLKDNLEKLEYWKLHVYIFYKLPIFIDYSLWDIGSNKTENYIELPFITDNNDYEIKYYSAIENNDNTNSNNNNTSYKYYITDNNKCSENTISTSLGAGKINRSRLNQYKKKIIEIFIHGLRKCLDKLIDTTTSPNRENPRFLIGNMNNNIDIIDNRKIYKYITNINRFASINHLLSKEYLDTLGDLQKYNESYITRQGTGPLRSIYGIKQSNVSSKENIQQDVQQEIANIERSKTSINNISTNSTIKNSRLKALNIRLNIEKKYLVELFTLLQHRTKSPLTKKYKNNNLYEKEICNIETRSKYNSLMNQIEISLNKFLDDENFLNFAIRTYPNISDILQREDANKVAKLNGIKILFLITFIHYQYKILELY